MANNCDVISIIKQKYDSMSKSHKAIANFIYDHYDQAVFMTAAKIGEELGIIGIIIFFIVFGIKYHQDSNFNFKTLESMCEDFKISGSLSYNDKKSSIYIANIDYCGKEDNTIYTDIECVLYESHENINKEITRMNYDGDSITLDEYLSSVVITVDDYKQDCKKYSNNSLFLSVNAKDLSGKTITYTIPLSFGNTCSN